MAREMKDSGTIWLDKIPKDWGLSKISSIYELRTQKVSDRDYPPLSVTMNGVVPQLDTAAKTNAHDDRKLIRKGDFVINSRSDRRGSCGVSEYDGSVSLINIVMKPMDEMNPDYYNWLFHTTQFADEFYKWGHGIVDDLWTTNWQDMKYIDIPVLSLPEQKKIADYLNKIVPEIDSLSLDIQSQIHILEDYKKSVITETVTKGLNPDVEMKDSGIEWIAKIPVNWKNSKIKYKFDFIGGFAFESNRFCDETQNQVLRIGNVKDDIILLGSNPAYIEDDYTQPKYEVKKDYILFTMTGTIHKKDYFYTVCIDEKMLNGKRLFLNQRVGAFVPKEKQNSMYFSYLFKVPELKDNVFLYETGTVNQGNIGIDALNNIEIIVPPYEEQSDIVNYLNKKCKAINEAINEKREQLEVLEQYKKSLIYEYVTGKREVSDNNG